jgi:hypothetical protein
VDCDLREEHPNKEHYERGSQTAWKESAQVKCHQKIASTDAKRQRMEYGPQVDV